MRAVHVLVMAILRSFGWIGLLIRVDASNLAVLCLEESHVTPLGSLIRPLLLALVFLLRPLELPLRA